MPALVLLLLVVIALVIWALRVGVQRSRVQPTTRASPQALDALAQPYRGLMAEALELGRDVTQGLAQAPEGMRPRLHEFALKTQHLLDRAMPMAQRGSNLLAVLPRLSGDAEGETRAAAATLETDLRRFVTSLRTLRDKLQGVLNSAAHLDQDATLERDLEDALFEVSALEEVFSDSF